jgi:phosphatidylinositol-3-phosphatase
MGIARYGRFIRVGGRLAALATVTALLPLGLTWGGTAGAVTTQTRASAQGAARSAYKPPPIRHVWVIQLENEGYTQTFGKSSADPYLARTLRAKGALLKNYYSIGHHSLDNYIAEISGQAPDPSTQADCQVYTAFTATGNAMPPDNQMPGDGCVYPAASLTVGNQLTSAGRTWAAYMQDMGNNPTRDNTTATSQGPACGHPVVGLDDPTQKATKTDEYATRHEGFMYFESVIDDQTYCEQHILSFQPLRKDLSKISTTPNFSWVTPNLCNDGHDSPCANGDAGGLKQIDKFLKLWVPRILASPAYKRNGLLVITFDEGTTTKACCGEVSGVSASHPNVTEPGQTGPGGGIVGAVLLSPFIKPGTVSKVNYNHYSLLRSIEDLFGLLHLGDAAMSGVKSFGKDVYTRP